MVQLITNSIKTFWNKTDKYIILLIVLFSFVLLELFINFHQTEVEALNKLLNNLMQFSGIFSAIIITYVVAKVMQIRQERFERRKEIVKFANKVTDFRRIARVLVQCYGFWDKEMRSKMDNSYKELSFFDTQIKDYENQDKIYADRIRELKNKFYEEENIQGAFLYLDMKSLVLDDNTTMQLELYDRHDHDYTYPLDILEKWTGSHSGGNLWYCLIHKRNRYDGCFSFTALQTKHKDEILHLATKINPEKYSQRKFDKDLLADIGSDMDGFYLPRLYELTYINTSRLSPTLNFLLTVLFVTIISGVLTPLVLTSLKVDPKVLLVTSSISVSILCLSLSYFLLKFKKILNSEIKIG